MGMRILSYFYLCLLVACDSPSPALQEHERFETRIEGIRFTIWQRDEFVEIIRHGFARRSDHARLKGLMIKAAQSTTGCTLRPDSIEGDTGVLRARLQCD